MSEAEAEVEQTVELQFVIFGDGENLSRLLCSNNDEMARFVIASWLNLGLHIVHEFKAESIQEAQGYFRGWDAMLNQAGCQIFNARTCKCGQCNWVSERTVLSRVDVYGDGDFDFVNDVQTIAYGPIFCAECLDPMPIDPQEA